MGARWEKANLLRRKPPTYNACTDQARGLTPCLQSPCTVELTLLLVRKEPEKFDRAAARWHVRFLQEVPNVDLREDQAALALLAAIPANLLAVAALAELLSRRRSCERACEALVRWSGRRSTTSQASEVTGSLQVAPSSGEPPLCGPNQLELRMDGRPLPPGAAAHEDFVFFSHVRGRACRFSGFMSLQISTSDGPGQGDIQTPGLTRQDPWDFTDTYGPARLSGAHLFVFRYLPQCGEDEPFVAHVRVGDYFVVGKIRVFRCGIEPPPFD